VSGGPDVIIIKKKAKGHAAHGAAWKVAYADFVTAMMALFMVLWLLSQTDQETRTELSDYFRTGVFTGAPSVLNGGSGIQSKGFFDVGTQPKSAVTRAEVDVATAQVNLIGALNAVVISRTTLNTLMGIPVNTPTRVRDILGYQHVDFDPKTLLPEAFARRPEYRQIKARLEQAEQTVKQQFRNFFPTITASGTYGSARADMNEIYNYGVQLNWTIFDGGGKIALYKQAQAQRDAAQARVRDTELTIWQQAEQSYNTAIQSEEAIGAATKGVESADENFRLSQGRFDAGVANIIELTDAQLALTTAQATLVQALANYRIAIAQLERFLGRR